MLIIDALDTRRYSQGIPTKEGNLKCRPLIPLKIFRFLGYRLGMT